MSDTVTKHLPEEQANPVNQWTKRDTGWMLNLFGTAVGAGVLYLPVSASVGGIWPLVILSLLAGPMVWLAHRNLVRFCLSSKDPQANITMTMHEHFGERIGHWLAWAYNLSVYPILLMYAIGMTNVVISYMENQLHLATPLRFWLCSGLISLLVLLMHTREVWMLWAIKVMVYPLILTLICISVYMIPYWDTAVFYQPFSVQDMLATLFFTTPLLIFSFNHSPSCSAFAQTYRLLMPGKTQCEEKTRKILKRNTVLLMVVILFFVFSCVLSLTPADMAQAKADNLPVLSVLGDRTGNDLFSLLVPLIAFMAIVSSFFGTYLGTLEGLQGASMQLWSKYLPNRPVHSSIIRKWIVGFILITCWWAGYANWSVISIIETLVVPILAIILYVMPVYAHYHIKQLKDYQNKWLDLFIVCVGLIIICGFLVEKVI